MNDSQRFKTNVNHLLLLTKSDRWPSALRTVATNYEFRITVFSSAKNLRDNYELYTPCCVAIVVDELAERNSGSDATALLMALKTDRIPVFALGGYSLFESRLGMIRSNFAELFTSTAEANRLCQLVTHHFAQTTGNNQTIESVVVRDLPWPKST